MTIYIPIPETAKCLLKKNQEIKFGDPFLEKNYEAEIKIELSKKLAVKPERIFKFLKKFVGEKVDKDELIASYKGLFTSKKIHSPQKGVIKEINHLDGTLTLIAEGDDRKTVKSYFKGSVLDVKKNRVEIEVVKGENFPVKNSSGNFGGEVFYLETNNMQLSSQDLSEKIVFVDSISGYLQAKIEALGSSGFVSLSKLPDPSSLPFSQLKNIDDFKKILKLKFSCCTVDVISNKIYFYQ